MCVGSRQWVHHTSLPSSAQMANLIATEGYGLPDIYVHVCRHASRSSVKAARYQQSSYPRAHFFRPEFVALLRLCSCPRGHRVLSSGFPVPWRGSERWLYQKEAGWLLTFLRRACQGAEWRVYGCRSRPGSLPNDIGHQHQGCRQWYCCWLTPWWSKRNPLTLSSTRVFSDDAKFFSFAFGMSSRKARTDLSFALGILTRRMGWGWVWLRWWQSSALWMNGDGEDGQDGEESKRGTMA